MRAYYSAGDAGHDEAPLEPGLLDADAQGQWAQGQWAQSVGAVSGRSQWAQPPALAGDPSVLKLEPQAQLLTAFGLLIAKPEPIREST